MSDTAAELMRAAIGRLADGDLAGARELVEAAATHWAEAGDEPERARCLRLASALARHDGRAELAVARAERAVEAVRQAAVPVGADLETGYAYALLAAGRAEEAVEALRRAAAALCGPAAVRSDPAAVPSDPPAPDPLAAARLLVDGVGRLQAAGRTDLAERLAGAAEAAVDLADDHAAGSELALLASARAAERGDPAAAAEHARRARAEALAGRFPVGYVAAAIAVAELAQVLGDRVEAYGSLAVGWATLRDLVGAEAARAAFEPQLLAVRQQWGPAGFAAAKAGYEAAAAARARGAGR